MVLFYYILLQNDIVVEWSKGKALPNDKINVTEKLKFVLGRVENIVEKGENAGYQHFLLCPQCFHEASVWVYKVIFDLPESNTSYIGELHLVWITCT